MNIGWIGTGNMGVRMAERLAKAGHQLYVYNRTPAKAQRVLDAGNARLLGSPAEIAEKCGLFFTSVTNDESMRQILCGENGLLQQARTGQILVEMSTLSAAFSAELREVLHRNGMLYLSAPVVGSMFMIEQGLLKVLASGDDEAYCTALPYLQDIGRIVVPLGGADQARDMKIAVNMMICSYLTLYGEVLMAGESMGFGWQELNDLLEQSGGASPMLQDKGTTHREREWIGSTALTSTAMKDLGLALERAEEGCFPLPLTALVCQYDRYMHFSEKYGSYSTFGTVGVLEDWHEVGTESYPTAPQEKRDAYAGALGLVLTGVSALLTAEAMRYCRAAGVERTAALECLGTCHGASAWFREFCAHGTDNVTFGRVRDAFRTVLLVAKERGLFLPILAAANEELNRAAAGLRVEDKLSALLT